MLNVRQRRFALNIFNGMSQREAYIDAYNPAGAVETIDANASALVSNSKVARRVEELLGSIDNSAVATIQERKEILTGIIRADITDYIKESEPVLNNDSLNTGAVSSFSVTESLQGQVTRRIKLRDPIAAISELNKMESVGGVGHVTVNDNRSMTINVMDEATRDRVLRIATRTRKIESTGTSVMSTSKLIDTVSEDENVGGDNATNTSERE
ncbi:hypothetical protein LCGC14_2716290 [marine sediment metagenome]|uniref:Uncharacterized protein n=1 Tax=marine sediment metagenome TaxID=412755 RepID=A0A0F8ZBH9_9ZZZZ